MITHIAIKEAKKKQWEHRSLRMLKARKASYERKLEEINELIRKKETQK